MGMKNANGGYIGLVVLLVSVAILAILYVRTYFSPTSTPLVTPEGAIETTTTVNQVQVYHQDIDAAKKLQQKAANYNDAIKDSL
jgi:predicted Abi (CAAX) family protease